MKISFKMFHCLFVSALILVACGLSDHVQVNDIFDNSTKNCFELDGNCTKRITFQEQFFQELDAIPFNLVAFKIFFEKFNLISTLVTENNEQRQYFTIFVPTTNSFHRWQPIDWGFDPFAVDEFTKALLLNHIVLGLYDFKNAQKLMLTNVQNNTILVYNNSNLFARNESVHIIKEYRKPSWSMVVIERLMFINDEIVSELHKNNRDKEYPPLILGKWFRSPFLSYVHYMLKDNKNISVVMQILERVSLEDIVTDKNYTFFMPVDNAFKKFNDTTVANLDNLLNGNEDNELNDDIVRENARFFLLNHIIHSRIYLREYTTLGSQSTFISLAKNSLKLLRTSDGVLINNASIVSDPVYIFNVGTVYYIDSLLIPVTNEVIVTTKQKQ